MPSISSTGAILYSLYDQGGYKIALLENYEIIDNRNVGYEENYFNDFPLSDLLLGDDIKSEPYKEQMLSMSIFPKIMFDYNTIKPGFYFMNNEVLDRYSIFGGISVNKLVDIEN